MTAQTMAPSNLVALVALFLALFAALVSTSCSVPSPGIYSLLLFSLSLSFSHFARLKVLMTTIGQMSTGACALVRENFPLLAFLPFSL